MEKYATVLIPVILLSLLLRIIALPIRWFWKISINSVCGFLSLWALNSLAFLTSLSFPVNAVTVLTAGFLGLPGIVVLALAQLLL